MAAKHFLVLIVGINLSVITIQSSFYSLQPAVEALAERELQLSLKNDLETENQDDNDDFVDSDDSELNNDYDNSGPSNSARYLSRSNSDYGDFYPSEYKKRFMLRKRDGSIFRERSRLSGSHQHPQQAVVAEKFLNAIEEDRNREREQEYKQQLRSLWNRWDIEKELFNDNDNDLDDSDNNAADDNNKKKKKKRQGPGEAEIAPSYWSNKRSMPLLPWLPASRKKRFPVKKRSPQMNGSSDIPDDTVSKDLQGIFGSNADDDDNINKKKKSNEEIPISQLNSSKNNEQSHDEHETIRMHSHSAIKKKRNVSDPDDYDENENDGPENVNDNDGDETEDDDDDDNDDNKKEADDDDNKKKKRKRDARSNSDNDDRKKRLARRKKNVQWSSLFGVDRKKKSLDMVFDVQNDNDNDDGSRRRKKRCPFGYCSPYPVEYVGGPFSDYGESEDSLSPYRKKRLGGLEKLDAMDKKLQIIENLILSDTARYYTAPPNNPLTRHRLAERLATAYNLAKMRKAIANLKHSASDDLNLEGDDNYLQGDDDDSQTDMDKKKKKRVAVKKEKVEFNFPNKEHEIDVPTEKVSSTDPSNAFDDSDDDKKRKRKRAQKKSESNGIIKDDEPLSEGIMGGGSQNGCPLLDSIEKRCRGIDILTGDIQQNLLQTCGIHQLCYLCGDSDLQCDYQYLNEAEKICEDNYNCKQAARQSLAILKTLPGRTKIGPRECVRNSCISTALNTIN